MLPLELFDRAVYALCATLLVWTLMNHRPEKSSSPVSCPRCPLPPRCGEQSYGLIPLERLFEGSAPAVIVSPYGSRPWGTQSQFAAPEASWIWGPGSSSHPSWVFFTRFRNNSKLALPTTLHIIADQYGIAYLDGELVGTINQNGWVSPEYSKFSLVISPGEHVLIVYVENTIGLGGLIAAMIPPEGNPLNVTDLSWRAKKISKRLQK